MAFSLRGWGRRGQSYVWRLRLPRSRGYLIEDGSLSPVRGAILAGNGPQALKDVLAVGDDLHFEPGICGKLGQGVPVTDGQPTLLIKELTVGGSDTDYGF